MNYVIQCRFKEFLIQLCIKKIFVLGISAEILLTRYQGVPGVPCSAIFGVREEM